MTIFDGHFEIIKEPRLYSARTPFQTTISGHLADRDVVKWHPVNVTFQELLFTDDRFENPNSWEVHSLADIHKYRNIMGMEDTLPLPLPPMSEESLLIGENHLRKVSREGGREGGREGRRPNFSGVGEERG